MTILVYEEGELRKAKIQDLLEIVKSLLLLIPMGKVTSYKELALMLNVSPRLIGRLMAMNDDAPIIPCHRVVKSNGHIGGYSMKNGVEIKKKLLKFEGVKFRNDNHISHDSMISLKEFYE